MLNLARPIDCDNNTYEVVAALTASLRNSFFITCSFGENDGILFYPFSLIEERFLLATRGFSACGV
jgi:hypothetical protein